SHDNYGVLLRSEPHERAQAGGAVSAPERFDDEAGHAALDSRLEAAQIDTKREAEQLHSLFQPVDLERAAEQRPPVDRYPATIHRTERSVLVGLKRLYRARVNLGDVACRMDRAVEADDRAQTAGKRRRSHMQRVAQIDGAIGLRIVVCALRA